MFIYFLFYKLKGVFLFHEPLSTGYMDEFVIGICAFDVDIIVLNSHIRARIYAYRAVIKEAEIIVLNAVKIVHEIISTA